MSEIKVNYYVVIKRDSRIALLAGPFETLEAASPHIPACRRLADDVDPFTLFDEFMIGSFEASKHNEPGRFNGELGLVQL
jgi:hypothetical protein